MSPRDRPLVWLKGQVRTPPLSAAARVEAGFLLRGEVLGMPVSRSMPAIGPGCHELRIVDAGLSWRIMYHVAADAIVVLDVFAKKTPATPTTVIDACRKRLNRYRTITTPKKGTRDAR
jgi:hypothetical protein